MSFDNVYERTYIWVHIVILMFEFTIKKFVGWEDGEIVV